MSRVTRVCVDMVGGISTTELTGRARTEPAGRGGYSAFS